MNDNLTTLKWIQSVETKQRHEQSWDPHHRLAEDINNEHSHRKLIG